jgi:hypothetical protein
MSDSDKVDNVILFLYHPVVTRLLKFQDKFFMFPLNMKETFIEVIDQNFLNIEL